MRRVGAYEAKTHLPRLLDAVAGGETIEITRNGVPVAVLAPAPSTAREARLRAIAELRAFRAAHPLGDVTIRELIDEGRR
jgi:prevent-host-death family protein